jgi:virginiamycin B lyase
MTYPSLVPATRIAAAGAALAALLLLPAQAGARTDAVASVGGSIVEYALPSNGGNGFSVTSGPDGKVWFATGRDTAGRVDPNNPSDLVEYTLPSVGAPGGPQARGITTGSDGNLWVTEPDADRIAQVPTTGSPIQEFAPSPCGNPFTFCISYIASDSAGNLWFTESTRNEIGRINPLDPTHTIAEFHTGCCFPIGMTTGPDGNVWFTLYGGGIGRVTPDGVITEFPIHGGEPQAITAGPDGQLYFVEFLPPNDQDAIGRMDVDGNLTGDFPIHAGANPQTLTLGADGNIWIPELGLDSLGHLSPSGVYGEVPLPCTYSSPFGITSGPDGDIWFTDRQNGIDALGNPTSTPAIGRLDPKNLPADSRVCPTGAQTRGFWQNKNGQAIINGANQSALSTWLNQFNPFSDAPSSGLATYAYNTLTAATASGASMNAMLKAQMLAAAFDVYFSDPALGGNKINAPTPIGGVTIDLTKICETIDGSGCSGSFENVSSAFGGPASVSVMNMLLYQNTADPSADAGANWYGQVKATQVLAKDAFDAINNQVAFSL